MDPDGQTFVARVAPTISSRASYDRGDGSEPIVAHTLRGEGLDASEDGTGRGTPLVPIAIQERAGCENPNAGPGGKGFRDDGLAYTLEARQVPQAIAFDCKASASFMPRPMEEIAPTMRAMNSVTGNQNAGGQLAVAVSLRGHDGGATAELGGEVCPAMRTGGGGGDKPHVLSDMAVRRLMPRECERLQGFKDNYTAIPWRGKPADECPDGLRYRAIGNSKAVPVVRWIGERIERVNRLAGDRGAP